MADRKDDNLMLVHESELSLVEQNFLNGEQLKMLLKKTPDKYVHRRPAKGGGEWEYVSGGYVRKVLNLMFGWDWSFEVLSEQIVAGQVIVKGKLTCNANGRTIVKTQFGCKDIICRKGTTDPLNLGNDFKAAATDALKKCAAEIGIAADIYNKQDFNAINVDTSDKPTHEEIQDLFTRIMDAGQIKNKDFLNEQEIANINRILRDKEEKAYNTARKLLTNRLKEAEA